MKTKTRPTQTVLDLSKPKANLGNLARYKQHDLELYISDQGEVYAHQSAMARMLGMQQGHLSSVLKSGILPDDKEPERGYTVKVPTTQGFRDVTLYGVETLIKLAERYNKEIHRKFAQMGAKVYLYQLAGYQVNVSQSPTVAAKEPTPVEAMKMAHEALGKLMRIESFASNLDGLQAYLAFAEKEGNQMLQGWMTVDQMAEYWGYELTPDQNRLIGRHMKGASLSQMSEEPKITRKRYLDGNNKHQSIEVREYPTKLLTLFDQICRNEGIEPTTTPRHG